MASSNSKPYDGYDQISVVLTRLIAGWSLTNRFGGFFVCFYAVLCPPRFSIAFWAQAGELLPLLHQAVPRHPAGAAAQGRAGASAAGRSHEQVADHGPAARRVSELRYSGAEGNRVYLQIVQMYLKEKPFLFGTIRVQSGRTTHKQAGTSSQRPAPCRQNE